MFKIFETYRGLPKSIYIIFFAQVINRFGDFVLPFLTLFLVKKMGLSFQEAGLAVTIATLASIPGSFAGGKISDHFGRKRTYMFFQLSAAFNLFLCAFFNSPGAIVTLVCIASFFNGGVRPIIGAIITDVLPADKRTLGFSLSYLGINLGVSLGPLVAGFLFNNFIKMIFIVDALTSLIAVTLVLINIKESLPDHRHEKNENHKEKHEQGNVFSVLWRRPQILIFLIINILFSVAYTQHVFSLPIMLDSVFNLNGPKFYGFVMSTNAISVLVLTMFITRVTKEWNPLSCIALAGILYGVGFGMIGIITTMPLFILSTIIWTTGEIMIVTNFSVYIANNTPQNFRARFNAVTSLSWSIGAIIGTSAMGKYMDHFGVKAVWPLVLALAFSGTIGMYLLKIKTEDKNRLEEVI